MAGSGGRWERAAALGISYLLDHHGWPLKPPPAGLSARDIWESSDTELIRILNIPESSAAGLLEFRPNFSAPQALDRMSRLGIEVVARGDDLYPPWLGQMYDPPPALFVKGAAGRLPELCARPRVAIVGARAASRYGLDAARVIATDLSRQGICIVSGMALGIDAAAHEGALRGGGSTIAVLGCGADVIYPRRHTRLYRRILEAGVVVSEYPPSAEPRPWRFPARNRIIAGLSQGVLVVEAREKSGALITADFCLEQGREVWALPGSIFSDLSGGPHRLIRLGATAAASAADILEDLGIEREASVPDDGEKSGAEKNAGNQDLGEDERLILKALGPRAVHPDVLSGISGLDGARTGAALVRLEIMGLARADPAGGYSI